MSETATVLQEEIGGQFSYLDSSTKKSTFAEAERDNAFNEECANLLAEKGYRKEAGRCVCCGEVYVWKKCEQGHREPHRYSNCGQPRLCPRCARIDREREIREIMKLVGKIESRPVVGHRWRKITLPVKTNGHYLEAAQRGWKAFRKLWRNLLRADKGACYVSAEFGEKSGNFHLHLLHYGQYIDQGELSDEWGRLTGDSYVVDVRSIKGQDLQREIRETIKYLCKFERRDANGVRYPEVGRTVEIWEALRGQRVRLRERLGLLRKDCLERWLGEELEEEFEEPDLGHCDICGLPFTEFERNCQTPRAPPVDPDVTPIRAMHDKSRARVDEEVAQVQEIMFSAYQSGKEMDLEWAKKRARCLQGRGEKEAALYGDWK